jgi:hypothetical protein
VLYARFIGDTPDYVLNQMLATTLAKDKDFSRGVPSTRTRLPAHPPRVRRVAPRRPDQRRATEAEASAG